MIDRLTAGPLTLVAPSGWARVQPVEGTDAVLLAPETPGGGFRPNLVVHSESFSGSQAKLSTVTLAGHQVMLAEYHLIDVAPWDAPVPDGRRFEYLHRSGSHLVHCMQYSSVVDNRSVHLTFSVAEAQLAGLDDTILGCVDTVKVAA